VLQYKVQRGRVVLQVSIKNPSAGGHACCRFCGNVIMCKLTMSSLQISGYRSPDRTVFSPRCPCSACFSRALVLTKC